MVRRMRQAREGNISIQLAATEFTSEFGQSLLEQEKIMLLRSRPSLRLRGSWEAAIAQRCLRLGLGLFGATRDFLGRGQAHQHFGRDIAGLRQFRQALLAFLERFVATQSMQVLQPASLELSVAAEQVRRAERER